MSENDILIEIKGEITNLKKGLKNAEKELSKFSKKSKDSLDKTSGSFINLKTAASTALGFGFANLMGMASGAVKDFSVASIKAAIASERAFESLQLQTHGTAETLIKELKVASNNTIANLDLVNTANKALALGISKNQLPELMEVATARSKVMGITATQAFEDISTGIGRQSKLILDNLGIIISLEDAYEDYAFTLDKSADQLNDFEKKQAITNQIMMESQAIVTAQKALNDDLATSLEQATAAVKDYGVAFAETFVEGLVTIKDLATAKDVLTDDTQWKQSTESIKVFAQEVVKIDGEIRGLTQNFEDTLKSLSKFKEEFTIEGEAQFGIDEQKLINSIDTIEFALNKLERGEISDLGADKFAAALENAGLSLDDFKDKERFVREESGLRIFETVSAQDMLQERLEQEKTKLEEIRMERKIIADNELSLLDKKAKAAKLEFRNNEVSLGFVKKELNTRISSLQTMIKQKEQLQAKADNFAQIIKDETRIRNLREQQLESTRQEAREARQLAAFKLLSVGFTGPEIFKKIRNLTSDINKLETSPSRLKTPATSSFGSSNVTLNIQNLTATDPSEAASIMEDLFSGKINTGR